jgi:hypothetical protein
MKNSTEMTTKRIKRSPTNSARTDGQHLKLNESYNQPSPSAATIVAAPRDENK